MDIFFAILGLIGFVYLNGRISEIDRKYSSGARKAPDPSIVPVKPPTPEAHSVAPPIPVPVHRPASMPLAAAAPRAPEVQSNGEFNEVSGGRWLGIIGIIALFIGIGFFLKYAFDTGLITIVGRIVLGVAAGIVSIGTGQYLRAKYEQYAYLLIGGGIAILYLCFYAAFGLYHLISQPAALMLMILVTTLTVTISIVDDYMPLSILAAAGGFASPFMVSTGQNDPIGLFTYIAILNIALLAVAIMKRWSPLIFALFLGTVFEYLTWYWAFYTADQLPVALFFLTVFFLTFLFPAFFKNHMGSGVSSNSDVETLARVMVGVPYLAVIWVLIMLQCLASGQHDPTSIFTYLAVLDVALISTAIVKRWIPIIYILFAGTALQIVFWYSASYSLGLLPVALFFLTIFFLLFLFPPIIESLLVGGKTRDEDLGLLSLNALGYFGFSYAILNGPHHDVLWILALLLGAIYFAFAYFIYRSNPDNRPLSAYYAGIGTIFVTLAIPLKLDHSWITLAWLLEAALLHAIAFNYRRPTLLWFGGVIYLFGVGRLFWDYLITNTFETTPFFNQYFALFLVAIAAAYFIAYIYKAYPDTAAKADHAMLAGIFFVLANVLTVYIFTAEIFAYYANLMPGAGPNFQGNSFSGPQSDLVNQRNTVISVFWTFYSMLLIGLGFALRSRTARILGLVFFFITALKIFTDVWSLGEIYRILASIAFGVTALLASFIYVKYSARVKEIIYE